MKSCFALHAVLAVLALAPTLAFAQPSDDERARGHFQAGQSYFDQGRYAESAIQFDEAYRLSHRSLLLANAALAYERAGDLPNAIARLEAYLALDAPEVEAARVSSTTRLESLRARLAAETQTTPPPAPETQARAEPDEPTHPAAPAPRSRRGLRIAGLTIAGVGLGLGGAALALNLRARAIRRDLNDVCGPSRDACPPSSQADIDRGETFSTLSVVGMAGSLTSIATGTTLFVLGRSEHEEGPHASAALDFGPRRFSLTAYGCF